MRDLDTDAASFSDLELEFFRAGDALSSDAQAEWNELEPAPPAPRTARPASEPSEEEWEWQIAVARARHATQPGM